MAINASDVWQKHSQDHRLSSAQCREIFSVAQYTRTPEESKELDRMNMPSIIISASGMATGGRVLHHLKAYIGDPKNTILFAGYQAAGTRGSRLLHHETEIKIHGHLFPVRAEIDALNSLSAHADYQEIIQWLGGFDKAPRKIFLTHGEAEAASSLKFKIEDRLGWNVTIPEYLEEFEL